MMDRAYALSRQDAAAKALVAVHRKPITHPRTHRLLISTYTGLIGEKRANREILPLARAAPSVVKIDVEGFEGEVLDGLADSRRSARAVLVEVHLAALARRSLPEEPIRILGLLRDQGFSVRWLDSSRLLASR